MDDATLAANPLIGDTPIVDSKNGDSTRSDSPTSESLMSPAEIRLLSALGFMAARSGHVVPAIRIFEGLAVLRKDKAFPYVGLALAMICVGAYGDAANVLRERGLVACPGDPEIEAYLGLALQLAGRTSEATVVTRELQTRKDLSSGVQALVKTVSTIADGNLAIDRPRPASVAAGDAVAVKAHSTRK